MIGTIQGKGIIRRRICLEIKIEIYLRYLYFKILARNPGEDFQEVVSCIGLEIRQVCTINVDMTHHYVMVVETIKMIKYKMQRRAEPGQKPEDH